MASTAVIYDLIARDSASATFGKVGKAADGMGSKMAKVGKAAVALGAGLVALGAGAAAAADKAAEFQSSMTKIQTQAGASAKDVKTLSKAVLELAPSTQQGPQQLSEALYHLKSVGLDNAKAMTALKTASDLAAVGGADLEDTTNALAGAWRTGIKGATNFGQAAATVNAIIGAGNMTMTDFTDALSSGILPTAKTFGLTLSQVGSALALFTDEGVPANSAATRLRMSISLLGAPSAAAEKQLSKIGLTGLDLANAMRGPNGIIGAIELLKQHLDASGLSAAQQSQILSRAFGGGKSSSAILSMVNNLDVLKQKQDQVNASMGKFAGAVKTQRQTAEAQWKILSSNLQTLTINLGLKLLPPITNFVKFINTTAIPTASKFGKTLGSLVPVSRIASDLGKVQASFAGFFSGLAKKSGLGSLWDKLTKPPKPLDTSKLPSTAYSPYGTIAANVRYTGGPTTSPYGTIAPKDLHKAGVMPYGNVAPQYGGTVTPYGDVAAQITKGAPKSPTQTAGQQIAKVFTDALGAMDWTKLGPMVGKGLAAATDWVVGHADDLSKSIAKVIGGIDWVNVGKSVGTIALPALIGFIDNLFQPLFTADFWKKHWVDVILAVISVLPIGKVVGTVGKLLEKVPWGKLGDVLGSLLKKIPWGKSIDLAKWIGKVFSDGAKKAGGWIDDIVGGIKSAVTDKFPKMATWFGEQLYVLPDRIGDLGRQVKKKGKELLDTLGKAIVDNVPGMGKKFLRSIAKVWGRFTFYQTGIHLIEGLYNGIVDKLTDAYNWFKKNVVDWIVTNVKSLFGIHSPSTVFASIGGNLISGLYQGIQTAISGVGKWLKTNVINPALNAFVKANTWLLVRGGQFVSGLKNGIVNGAKSVGSWVTSHVITPARNAFAKAGSWLLTRGAQVVSGLKNGVLNGAKSIATWAFTHVAQPLTSRFSAARSWLTSRGSQLISGLKSGITGAMKNIGSWIGSNFVNPIVHWVEKHFGIASPSKVFATIGGHLVAGLVKGLATHDGDAIVKKIFGSMPKALGALVKKGLVHVEQLPGKALSALGGLGGDFLSLLGLGGGSGTSGSNQSLGKQMMLASGWSAAQWPALKALWTRESGWRTTAKNPSSGAYGIPQSLPASKMASAGKDWMTNPATQIKWGLGYILSRYGSPAGAWAHEGRYGWYDQGGMLQPGATLALNGTGKPERIRTAKQEDDILAAIRELAKQSAVAVVHIHVDDDELRKVFSAEVERGMGDLETAFRVGSNG